MFKKKKPTNSDNLKRGTIEVAKEFGEWLKERDKHRNDGQTVTIKGVFAGAMM